MPDTTEVFDPTYGHGADFVPANSEGLAATCSGGCCREWIVVYNSWHTISDPNDEEKIVGYVEPECEACAEKNIDPSFDAYGD